MKLKSTLLTSLVLTSWLAAGVALADPSRHSADQYDEPTVSDPSAEPSQNGVDMTSDHDRQQRQQSVTQADTTQNPHTLRDEVIGIAPEIGQISYTNQNGAYTSRAMAGIGLNFNFASSLISPATQDWYMGVTTGAFYSHNGSDSGNFVGTDASTASRDDSNLIMIPVDAKIGYNLNSAFRLSAHGGGNLIYRSVANSINLGAGSDSGDSLWRIYPNVGAEAEWQVSKNVSILLRPDVTISPGYSLLTATLGANIIVL